MNKLTESIFDGNSALIPMADVQHIEKHWYTDDKREKENYRGILIITKHTKWNKESDTWENNIYLSREEADRFLKSWCNFRHELDEVNL